MKNNNSPWLPRHQLAFPGTGWALRVVAVLLPGVRRLKVWAFAGLVFGLVGALCSRRRSAMA